MRIKSKFKLSIDIPTSTQSDIAFLLIIFFIVTAIFFERTGITFKLPDKESKSVRLSEDKVIKVELYNDKIFINKNSVSYADVGSMIENIILKSGNNKAIIYFANNLKYKNFIYVFQEIKRFGNLKVAIKKVVSGKR